MMCTYLCCLDRYGYLLTLVLKPLPVGVLCLISPIAVNHDVTVVTVTICAVLTPL